MFQACKMHGSRFVEKAIFMRVIRFRDPSILLIFNHTNLLLLLFALHLHLEQFGL